MIKVENGKVIITGSKSNIIKDFLSILRAVMVKDLINFEQVAELTAMAQTMNELSELIGMDKLESQTDIEVDMEELKKQMEEKDE